MSVNLKETKRWNPGDSVFIYNRELQKNEVGSVIRRYKREKIYRYDVKLERGPILEFVSTNLESNFFINEEMTEKFFQRINQTT